MKKLLSLVLTLTLAFSLAACTNSGTTENSDSVSQTKSLALRGRKTWRYGGTGGHCLGDCQRDPAHHRCDEAFSGGGRRKSGSDRTEQRGDGAAGNAGERGKRRHKGFLGKSHGMILLGEKRLLLPVSPFYKLK